MKKRWSDGGSWGLLALLAMAFAQTAVAQSPAHAVRLNPSAGSYDPVLAVDGEAVHAVGLEPDGLNTGYVHYARSLDGGRTWPVREVPIGYASRVLAIDADGDVVVVLVHSLWLGPYAISSQDGGSTWALPVKLSAQSIYNIDPQMAVHVDGLNVNVFWLELRSAGRSWHDRSIDGGLTWQSQDTALDAGVSTGSSNTASSALTAIAHGPVLDVLWVHEAATGPVTLHQRSTDGGASWLPVATIAVPGVMQAGGGGGSRLFVSRGSPLDDVYSPDGGATWSTMPRPGLLGYDSVAVDGQNVIVTQDTDLGLMSELRINVSRDGGDTWLPQPFLIPVPYSFTSRAYVVGDVFVVRVSFFRELASPGSLIRSDDGGVSWRLVSDEASLGFWPGRDRALVTTTPSVGAYETYAYVASGHTAKGQGAAGTAGRVPRLEGRGLSGIGAAIALELDEARANAVGAIAASFAPAVAQPFGAVTVWVQSPAVAIPVAISAAGSAGWSLQVPADPAFAGLTLTSQAFVLDPVAVAGLAASRAIESWIY